MDSRGDISVMQSGEGPVSIPLATQTRGSSFSLRYCEHELHTVCPTRSSGTLFSPRVQIILSLELRYFFKSLHALLVIFVHLLVIVLDLLLVTNLSQEIHALGPGRSSKLL